jgi:hypothetical protein
MYHHTITFTRANNFGSVEQIIVGESCSYNVSDLWILQISQFCIGEQLP